MRALGMILFAAVVLAFAGAHDCNNVPECWPKAVEPCRCETGGEGSRICRDDALDYEECICLDAGIGSGADAGLDASIDAAPDGLPDAAAIDASTGS